MSQDFFKHVDVFSESDLTTAQPPARCPRLKAALLILWVICIFPISVMAQPERTIHVGFSASIFNTDVNHNDVLAATHAWGEAFVKGNDISAVTETIVFDSLDDIRETISSGRLDFISLATKEYAPLRGMLTDTVSISRVAGSLTTEYLLLVPRDSGFDGLEDLQGGTVLLLAGLRASLANTWLDILLLQKSLGRAADFFDTVEPITKIPKVVLPVFFGQADACVVTRNGFDTMVELNPQIDRKLKAIAVSPPLIPSLFCFVSNADPTLRKEIVGEMADWNLTPAGQQCMIVFQCEKIEEHPASIMEPSLALVAEHKRLLKAAGGAHGNASLSDGFMETARKEGIQ